MIGDIFTEMRVWSACLIILEFFDQGIQKRVGNSFLLKFYSDKDSDFITFFNLSASMAGLFDFHEISN